MKYGNIICDPNSEEAKRLIGKKVIGSDSYKEISTPKNVNTFELARINADINYPFMEGHSTLSVGYTFIREVIEETPKYRPYKDTAEMIDDFKKRFCSHTTIPQYSMPLIWIKNKLFESRILVTEFYEFSVSISGTTSFKKIFDQYTYLDGSPVGKEVKE